MPILAILSSALLIYSAMTLQECMTPPTPPASAKEKKEEYDSTLRHLLSMSAPLRRAIFWAFAISESVACLASTKEFSGLPGFKAIHELCTNTLTYPSARISTQLATSLMLAIIGGKFRIAAQNVLGNLFTWEITLQKHHRLITHGPYSVVRHPSYLGGMVLVAGMSMALFAPHTLLQECLIPNYPILSWIRAVFAIFVNITFAVVWVRASGEDFLMRGQFGAEWDAWAKKVPYKIVPLVY